MPKLTELLWKDIVNFMPTEAHFNFVMIKMKNHIFNWIPKWFILMGIYITSGGYSQIPEFEGAFTYSIEVDGPESFQFLENQPCLKLNMYFRGSDFIIHAFEGQFPVTRLFIADSSEMYIVDAENEVAYRRDALEDTSKLIRPPKAVFTGDSAMVNNILCKIYKVTKPKEVIYYYVSDKYWINPTRFTKLKDAQVNFLTLGLNGRIPLKTIRKKSGLVVTITATDIKNMELEEFQFRIPENFQIKVRDTRF
jgi:hypothetical protein